MVVRRVPVPNPSCAGKTHKSSGYHGCNAAIECRHCNESPVGCPILSNHIVLKKETYGLMQKENR